MENRHASERNRMDKPEIKLHKYDQLIFDRNGKKIPWGREWIVSKCSWKTKNYIQKNEIGFSTIACKKSTQNELKTCKNKFLKKTTEKIR